DYFRASVILHSLTSRVDPDYSRNSVIVSFFLNLPKFLQHQTLVSTTEIDGITHTLRSQADSLLYTTNLSRDRFTLWQTGLSVQFNDERDLSGIVFFSDSLVENKSSEVPFCRNLKNVVWVDVLIVKVSRGPMFETLVIREQHSFPVSQKIVHVSLQEFSRLKIPHPHFKLIPAPKLRSTTLGKPLSEEGK